MKKGKARFVVVHVSTSVLGRGTADFMRLTGQPV